VYDTAGFTIVYVAVLGIQMLLALFFFSTFCFTQVWLVTVDSTLYLKESGTALRCSVNLSMGNSNSDQIIESVHADEGSIRLSHQPQPQPSDKTTKPIGLVGEENVSLQATLQAEYHTMRKEWKPVCGRRRT